MKSEAPIFIRAISDFDTWHHEHDPLIRQFVWGLKCFDTNPDADLWCSLIQEGLHLQESGFKTLKQIAVEVYPGKLLHDTILDAGKYAIMLEDNYHKTLLAAQGFETELEGHKALALNCKGNSYLFQSAKGSKQYELFIAFVWDGEVYTVSIYENNPNLDMSKIAQRLSGGGHVGAAGFVCKELPFKRTGGYHG